MGLPAADLKFFADYIHTELGIVYAPENYFQLEKRLVDITKAMSLPDEAALTQKAKTGITGLFKQLLLDIATNNETSFFRDAKAFTAIEKHIVPAIRLLRPQANLIRIWSAASSFGQEPYTLGMMLNEMRANDPSLPRFEIVATDISEAALKRASAALYSQLEVQRGLSASLLVKYFKKNSEDFWELSSEIKKLVTFKKQNLLDPLAALGEFDLILCRNVLIYQKETSKKEVVARIADRLQPRGFFLLGSAESLIGITDKFEQHFQDGAVYFQRKD